MFRFYFEALNCVFDTKKKKKLETLTQHCNVGQQKIPIENLTIFSQTFHVILPALHKECHDDKGRHPHNQVRSQTACQLRVQETQVGVEKHW